MFNVKWKLKHKETGEWWKHPYGVCLALKPDGAFLIVDSTNPWIPVVRYTCKDKEYDLYLATYKEDGKWVYNKYVSASTESNDLGDTND